MQGCAKKGAVAPGMETEGVPNLYYKSNFLLLFYKANYMFTHGKFFPQKKDVILSFQN